MSLSKLTKLIIFVAIFALPKLAEGKILEFGDKTWEVNPQTGSAVASVAVRSDMNLLELARQSVLATNNSLSQPLLDEETATKLNEIAAEINKPARDAKLVLDGKFAKEFEPGQNGQGLDVYLLRNMLRNNTNENIALPVLTSAPTNKLSETNNLGINELIAIGESDFRGSPRNRIHNINVGADRYNGLLIDKDEEFSFNKYLGNVDAENGYLPELVIKATGTVPEFGGGLCQVSSTAFRAAMNAGVPITARRNHSYAVQYYAPQGTDATIYPGVQDFKFKNDTGSPILVRTRIENNKLYFEYYGTKDTRQVAFEGPVQYDKKANGAMKATWTRHVTNNGETVTQTFNSVYQPPALFHRTEQSSTPNPEATPTPAPTPATPPVTIN